MTDDSRAAIDWNGRYFLFLCVVLAGYAVAGKGFAYAGFPPLYIGEIALLTGAAIIVRTGGLAALFASPTAVILAVMMAWTLFRTIPFFGQYGFDAPRDSIVIMYGGFSFIVILLLLDDPQKLAIGLRRYADFIGWLVPLLLFLFPLSHQFRDYIPHTPGSQVPLIALGPGEVPVHLAGAAVFAMAGLRRVKLWWVATLVVAALMSSALTRGGMLAFFLPVTAAAVALGKTRQMAVAAIAGALIFSGAYTFEKLSGTGLPTPGTERPFSAVQIAKNVESIFGAKDPNLEGSREWRLEWWGKIVRGTVFGDRFWTGRGFGINLALAEGYGDPRDAEPLRSPHNVNMTVLARAGVPGMALWMAFLIGWAITITNSFFTARQRGDAAWAGVFLWVGCYVAACFINATFDVALEGPMQGVWFWCLVGFGLGAALIYRWSFSAIRTEAFAPCAS